MQKTFWTSSERLMNIQFTPCVYGEGDQEYGCEKDEEEMKKSFVKYFLLDIKCASLVSFKANENENSFLCITKR